MTGTIATGERLDLQVRPDATRVGMALLAAGVPLTLLIDLAGPRSVNSAALFAEESTARARWDRALGPGDVGC